MMTFLPESSRAALDSFGPVSAVLVALLAALVITGMWEYALQEIELKRAEQKRRAADRLIKMFPASCLFVRVITAK
jgi:hypothetical protein